MMTEVSCGLFPMHVSAACVCTVPDVDASALSPHGASSFKRFFKARSPPDKEKGSDAAGRHPASPLVKASAVDAIIRGNSVREGGRLLVVSSVASWRRSCGEGVLMAKVDVAVAEIDVLRSCCWAGIGLLGAVTGVGWELGVPCRAPPLSDTQCVSVATQPCAVDRRVVWLLVAPALFGGPPCHPIISGVVLAPESARRRWCAGLGEDRHSAWQAEPSGDYLASSRR